MPRDTTSETCACCDSLHRSQGPPGRALAPVRPVRRWPAWASLAWMTAEGVIGLIAGFTAGFIALTGWALAAPSKALASVIVVWWFTGSRTLSETAERRAQKGGGRQLLAAIALHRDRGCAQPRQPPARDHLAAGNRAHGQQRDHHAGPGDRQAAPRPAVDSGATVGEGIQNLMCAAQAAAVLVGLAVVAIWPGGRPIDAVIALGIAAWSIGKDASHGEALTAADIGHSTDRRLTAAIIAARAANAEQAYATARDIRRMTWTDTIG